jgi:sphinganine-1-phosphate aldolase
VYTSFPNYPYGTVDPIDKIASICKRYDVPLHIDMCLGGYLVPFLKTKEGNPYFVVPQGVTSISLDCHKYGLSAKGASVLLFSSEKYRKEQLFVTSDWPGGFYGTIGIAGSRTGATISSAWISMMRLGVNGYTKNATAISNGTFSLT